MLQHPTITADLGRERQADLRRAAETHAVQRSAHETRNGSSLWRRHRTRFAAVFVRLASGLARAVPRSVVGRDTPTAAVDTPVAATSGEC